MKRILSTIVFGLASVCLVSFMAMQKKKVVFFGDSITQAGVGPSGYITVLQQMLQQAGKSNAWELIGAGIGGNKVYDLYLRMEEDVLAKKPDIVFIYIGINDVWHKRSHGTGTDADKFERFYHRLIDKIQASGAKVIICTPTVIGEKKDFVNELDGDLNRYAEIIRGIAKAKNTELVDLRKTMVEHITKNNPENKASGILTTDGVHMNEAGNRFLAEQFIEKLK